NSLGRTAARSELCRFVTFGRETGLPLARLALRGNRDGNSRNQSLPRLRHRSDAAMVAMVRRYLPDPCRSSHSTAFHAQHHGAPEGSCDGRSQAEDRPHPCAPELSGELSNRELRDRGAGRRNGVPRGTLCAILGTGDRSLRSPLWYGSPGRPPWPGLLATRVKFSGLRGAI